MLSVVASLSRRYLGPEAPKRRSVPPTCLRLASVGRQAGGPKSLVQCRESQAKKKSEVTRKESAKTQDYVSMPRRGVFCVEELGMVPSSVGEPLRVKHLCDGKCNGIGFKFYGLTAIVTEEGGAPHTTNLCRKCFDWRRKVHGEEKVNTIVWRDEQATKLTRQVVGRLSERSLSAINVGTIHGQEEPDKAAGKKNRRKGGARALARSQGPKVRWLTRRAFAASKLLDWPHFFENESSASGQV